MARDSIEKLDGKISDIGALSVMALFFSGFAFFACFFFLLKNADTEWNAVQVALTTFQIFLVIALAVGFWAVRREAIERAEDAARIVARACAEEEVQEYVRLFVTPKLIRQIIEGSEDIGGGNDLTEDSVNDMMDELE